MELQDIVSKPYFAYIVGEMGVGKSTFLSLLAAYEGWLGTLADVGKLFHSFPEYLPEKDWQTYLRCREDGIADPSIYNVQKFFAEQKITNIRKAAGIGYDRQPGYYFVDRSFEEDKRIYAAGIKNLFPDASYERYVEEYGSVELPRPDFVIRLKVESPTVSEKRVKSRGYGEDFKLSRYYKMAEDYLEFIDPWVEGLGVPIIQIRTDLKHFDYTDAAGQNYFLWSFLTGLHGKCDTDGEPFWRLPYNILPQHKLIECDNHA